MSDEKPVLVVPADEFIKGVNTMALVLSLLVKKLEERQAVSGGAFASLLRNLPDLMADNRTIAALAKDHIDFGMLNFIADAITGVPNLASWQPKLIEGGKPAIMTPALIEAGG